MPQVRILFKDNRPRDELDVEVESRVRARAEGDVVLVEYEDDNGELNELARYPRADVEAVVTSLWTLRT